MPTEGKLVDGGAAGVHLRSGPLCQVKVSDKTVWICETRLQTIQNPYPFHHFPSAKLSIFLVPLRDFTDEVVRAICISKRNVMPRWKSCTITLKPDSETPGRHIAFLPNREGRCLHAACGGRRLVDIVNFYTVELWKNTKGMLEDTMTNTYTAKKEMALSSQDEKINSYLHLLLGFRCHFGLETSLVIFLYAFVGWNPAKSACSNEVYAP